MSEGGIVGNYLLERELGRGGMGVVYAASHRVLGKPAAIKLLRAAQPAPDQIERFFNEARAAMAIGHPAIVEVYDVGLTQDGTPYLAMELLAGESLAARIARGTLPVRVAIDIAARIADALEAAHARDIIHRDLKPENVFLLPTGAIKLLDFGVAKLAPSSGGVNTSSGVMIGTPAYMSPEQCEGSRAIDRRSDLYALGCVIFAMLTGEPPFRAEGVGGMIGMHLHVAPPPLRTRCPRASIALEQLVAQLLAKSPEDRFPTARAVADALAAPAVNELAARDGIDATAPIAPSATPNMANAATVATLASGPTRPAHAAHYDPRVAHVPVVQPARRSRARIAAAIVSATVAMVAIGVMVALRSPDPPVRHAPDPDREDPIIQVKSDLPDEVIDYVMLDRIVGALDAQNDCDGIERALAGFNSKTLGWDSKLRSGAMAVYDRCIRRTQRFRAMDPHTDVAALVSDERYEDAMAWCAVERVPADSLTPCMIAACNTNHQYFARLFMASSFDTDAHREQVVRLCRSKGLELVVWP